MTSYFKNLHHNLRFYILTTSLIISLLVVSVLKLSIDSNQLFYIRLQQIYGLLAVIFLYTAVITTPLSKLFSKRKWLDVLQFARRAIGVSAAYFAVLHTIIVVNDQIGGLSNLNLLPNRFITSFILGGFALVVLLVMALTSFDKAIDVLTFKRWKRIHMFVYPAGMLIIIHVWMIGTHAASIPVRISGATALGILFALESYRMSFKLARRFTLSKQDQIGAGFVVFVILFGSLLFLPLTGGNYHSNHHEHPAKTRSTK